MSRLKSILLFLSIIIPVFLSAQTQSGTITSNETWQGIVRLTGDVIIAKNARLTILPGTQVLIAPKQDAQLAGYDKNLIEIIVDGELIAEGTDDNEIVFTSSAADKRMGDWFGIIIQNRKSTTSLTKTVVEYGFDGVTVIASRPNIYSSVIQYNFNSGITCKINAKPKIIDNTIFANGWAGVFSHKKAKPILSGNRISNNDYGVIIMKSGEANLGNLKGTGQERNPGQNLFLGNTSYALDNHSKYPIYAQNNTWTNAENLPVSDVSALIFDAKDNPGSGNVYYKPIFGQRPTKPIAGNIGRADIANQPVLTEPLKSVSNTAENQNPVVNKAENTQAELQPKTEIAKPESAPVKDVAAKPIAENKAPEQNKEDQKTSEEKTTVEEKNIPTPVKRSIIKPTKNKLNKPVQEWQIDSHRRAYKGQRPRPEYPSIALQTKTTGQVIIEVIVDEKGLVNRTKILKSSSEIFNESALEAVKKIKYVPMTMSGAPVKVKVIERYVYNLRK